MQAGYFPQKPDRSVMERLRRQQLKDLYTRLASLLPPQTSRVKLPLPALLDYALAYVKGQKERIHAMETKKEELIKSECSTSGKEKFVVQAIEVIEKGPILEVNLVTGLNKGSILRQVICILEEEGAQVLSANYSVLTDRVLYTVSSQAFSSRIGIETSRVHQRLKALSGDGGFSPAIQDKPGAI